ncbi:MAG: energy-coupling factor transporter transmembrane protein EcfT [Veillonellaceae bacterium]|nr:energy-coupling factor transporter transmembrane protein EcfT [Veillonellaceae bacterium]
MLTDIMLGQYFPGNSFVHKLDPRNKIVLTLVFIGSIFLAASYDGYLLLGLFLCLSTAVSGIPAKIMLRSIKPLWIILLLTAGIHIFMTPGTALLSVGPLSITQEGVRQAVQMSARLVFLIMMSSLLTFTTSPIALTDAVERLLSPLKYVKAPVHELAMMMTIALRFVPTLLEEADRIMKAQMARGADFSSGNLLKRGQNMVPLLVPLFISAFRRADDLATAMEARCYRGGEHRTRMKELQFGLRDVAAALVFAGLVAALGWLKWG